MPSVVFVFFVPTDLQLLQCWSLMLLSTIFIFTYFILLLNQMCAKIRCHFHIWVSLKLLAHLFHLIIISTTVSFILTSFSFINMYENMYECMRISLHRSYLSGRIFKDALNLHSSLFIAFNCLRELIIISQILSEILSCSHDRRNNCMPL